ncbi:serine hydrolase domain-containing protein [Alkalicoccus luteus]|uniref:Serine hydrolase n=1 Tax=Alkalicoccus luteus TaxID=1237094 RepID=A0A969PWS1_9BACI|nr:serine hydrolase [Alkalicoccus luteus]NJP37067.1 serine hydrolase [Alkalicoccus luteus]
MKKTVITAVTLLAAGSVAGAAELTPSMEPELTEESQLDGLPEQANAPDWVPAWERAGRPSVTLQEGPAQRVQMDPRVLEQMDEGLEAGIAEGFFPGAVALVAKEGTIVKHDAYGEALRYDAESALLPEAERIAAETDTIYDLASLTKTFTSTAAVQLIEAGELALDDHVADYIPEVEEAFTIRQLLTHTSGLPAWIPLAFLEDEQARWDAIYDTAPEEEPGEAYIYSDLNMILLGQVIEAVSGDTLDTYMEEAIFEPLGMEDTMFNPPAALQERIAATEPQPALDRGLVWGSVHDENAYSLGGAVGHAGLFSTTSDLAVFLQTLLNGGVYDGERILEADTVREMLTDQTGGDLEQGFGFNVNRDWFMGEFAPTAAGHTGFTGTSFVIDPKTNTIAILLTNRVHPTRDGGSINPWRLGLMNAVSDSINAHPANRRGGE